MLSSQKPTGQNLGTAAAYVFALVSLVVSACFLVPISQAATARMQKLHVGGRFLLKEDNTPFFLLMDTAWFLPKVTNAEVDRYLADRAAKGFTGVLITCSYHNDVYFGAEHPFIKDDSATPNPAFWSHIDHIVTQAESDGLYVVLTIMWSDDYLAYFPRFADTTKARNLGTFVGTRYRANNNVVFCVAGEFNDTPGWTKRFYDSVAQGLRAGDLGNHLITIHPTTSNASTFQNDKLIDFNMIQSHHWNDSTAHGLAENYDLIAGDYAASPVKPTMDAENAYEDLPDGLANGGQRTNPRIQADTNRRKAYWALFAGACGHTFGNQNIQIMWRPGDPDGGVPATLWSNNLNSPGATQMRYLRDLMESHSFLKGIPDQSVVTAGIGTGLDHVQAIRASDGRYALIYIPRGTGITVNMSKLASSITASWFNPRDGSSSPIGCYPNVKTQPFTPPTSGTGNDWVLVLETGPTPTPTPTPS
jgi:hypothetical protein